MASATAITSRIQPALDRAASRGGRAAPRIVAGLPIAVHNDVDEAKMAVAATASGYAGMVNYRRIIEAGGGSSAADVVIVGDESTVARELFNLLDAGVTDVWAQPVAVGSDRVQRAASLHRTRGLLSELTRQGCPVDGAGRLGLIIKIPCVSDVVERVGISSSCTRERKASPYCPDV